MNNKGGFAQISGVPDDLSVLASLRLPEEFAATAWSGDSPDLLHSVTMGVAGSASSFTDPVVIRTPDQRLRVFVSSTLKELEEERQAVRQAILNLRLAPVMFESGARPYPAKQLYQAYLSQSHIFIGIYWQSYGWVAPDMQISGLEDEYNLAGHKPILIYIRTPADARDPGLVHMLERIKGDNAASYKYFSTPAQLRELVENDLMLVLTEYFETAAGTHRALVAEPQVSAGNLPIPRNELIGRERELAAASDLLLRPDAALITLAGSAGAGKSRLGIEIARKLQDHFADGAYLVTLESIQDAKLVISAIAKTLGVKEMAPRQSLSDALKLYLSGKEILLLLDNFEQVLPAAPRIAELLEAAPRTKILATSRAPLRIRPERELKVAPLALPPKEHILDPEALLQYASVRLFVERAQGVRMDFRLTSENAAAVAEICRRLDGLPLAIELAAARIRMLPPQALLVRLRDRLEVLRGDTRDLPQRQRTLYDAIDWSYHLLSDDDKRLLQYLSVFVGGWTLESAEAVCEANGEGSLNVFDGLERLMNNNLLKPPEETHGEVRMRQFETVRDFAYRQLVQGGEAGTIEQRYRRFFVDLVEKVETGLLQYPTHTCHDCLETELDNLRAVMRSAIEVKENEDELRIACALGRFWWSRGYWSEGIQWLKAGLADSKAVPVPLKANALTQSAWLWRFLGDYRRSIAQLEESLVLWQQTTDHHGYAIALGNLAASVLGSGDRERATALANEALKFSRQHGDLFGRYYALQVLGLAASQQGNTMKAIQHYTEALALAQEAGDDDHSANILNALGGEYITEGKLEQAEDCFSRAATIATRLGNRVVGAFIPGNRGEIALKKGNYGQAFDLLSESMSMLKEMGDQENTILCLEAFAYLAKGCHLADRAARLLGAGETLRKAIGFTLSQPMQADYDSAVAELMSQLGEAAFQADWAEGSRMTYSQATAYAVDKSWRPDA